MLNGVTKALLLNDLFKYINKGYDRITVVSS